MSSTKWPCPSTTRVVVAEDVAQLDRARPAGRSGQPEAELVDGEAQILHLVVVEPQPAGQAGRGDPGQAKELR